jgi:hypothetical protein|tara:strand:- start:2822 stop:3361 length:540 start_codon:yes stop_codon:yes gene_type:complete
MRVQTQFLLINIFGGIAVLGGYVIALINNPETRNELWGGVPENLRLWITAFMFISAFGYCFAMYYLIFDEGLSLDFFWGKFDYKLIRILLIIFLLTAALWIHTTFLYIESGSKFHWGLVQFELWLTGVSVFLIMLGIASATKVENSNLHFYSIIGLSTISFHCLILDAFLWLNKFPLKH